MSRAITLVGLDCGSTTTSAILATAQLATSILGRVEITQLEPTFRSELVFTPFDGDTIDEYRLEHYLNAWLSEAAVRTEDIFGGGALITGLAAERSNATAVSKWLESRMADAVVATANDPLLESWLAFMGNCHALSKSHPNTPILNIDIGGGTTNLALGIDGQVIASGALFVGARHFQLEPGTYLLKALSPHAVALLNHLEIDRRIGDRLQNDHVQTILNFYVALIEKAIASNWQASSAIERQHVQVPMILSNRDDSNCAITLSGGVGQLVYSQLAGGPALTAQFGDLGSELAARIVQTESITARMTALTPFGLGRATVYGLLQHSSQLSGSTIYLPDRQRLPLKDVPIVGRFEITSSDEQLSRLLALASQARPGGCIQVELVQHDLATLRHLAARFTSALEARPFPSDRVLVLLLPANLGKVFGNYVSRWGTLKVSLIVIDEVSSREAQFLRVGQLREGVVPVWLYGMR